MWPVDCRLLKRWMERGESWETGGREGLRGDMMRVLSGMAGRMGSGSGSVMVER
jgi:hypothetical protein